MLEARAPVVVSLWYLERCEERGMRKKTLQGMDDDQLLALYSAGEAVAGEILLGRYRPSVLDFFTRRLPAADADGRDAACEEHHARRFARQ